MTETFPLSEETQTILRYASQLAQDYHHPVVFPEHLLLSISAYQTYQAHKILTLLGVKIEEMGNLCQLSIARQNALLQQPANSQVQVAMSVHQVLEEGVKSAHRHQKTFLETAHVLIGLLKPDLNSAGILNEKGVTTDKVRNLLDESLPVENPIASPKPKPQPVKVQYKFQVSPVFLTLVSITILAGASAYFNWLSEGLSVFLFVIGGWVVSLCLHEFGHAIVAYWAGDDTVIDKGYLTLDPFKYTHTLMSIFLPLIIVMMGGIGLPGGAVYINRALIRHRYQHSLVSAAGPLANIIFSILLAIPFVLGLHRNGHGAFWAGVAMLAVLQITAIVLNLLPLPGLDGFGILAPYLPQDILRLAYSFGQLTFFLIFFLFFYSQGFQRWFWGIVFQLTSLIQINPFLFLEGYEIFRFWS